MRISSYVAALVPRKGGGGGHGSSGSHGSSGGKGSTSSGGDSGESSHPISSSSKSSSGSHQAIPVPGLAHSNMVPYGGGGGKPQKIPSGQPFVGRYQGGGTRDQVYGTNAYGSGYPGANGNFCFYNCPFPYYFWPVVWTENPSDPTPRPQDVDSREYGNASNTSRPGGPMMQIALINPNGNTKLYVLSDNATAFSLAGSIAANCTLGNTSSLTPQPLNFSEASAPVPEEAIQYYRASTVGLILDGYNNTAALTNNTSTPDTPLPSMADLGFITCVNETIGTAVPLISGASSPSLPMQPLSGTAALLLLIIHLLR